MPSRPGHILLAVLGFGVAVLGGYAVYAEGDAYLAGTSSIARVAAWTRQPVVPGLSIATQKLTLLDCENALLNRDALELRYVDQTTRDAIAPVCLELADGITATAPSHAYGWYVGALASARLGDWPSLNARLQQSLSTGPLELWIAQRRFALADRYRDHLDAGNADLRLMLLTPTGLAPLLDRYTADAHLRGRIAAVVDALPDDERQLALGHLVSALDLLVVAQ